MRRDGVKKRTFPSWDDENPFYENEPAAGGHLVVLADGRHVGFIRVARPERKRDESHHAHRP